MPDHSVPTGSQRRGFTLIELLVVLAIVAMLLTLALPRYFHSVERSREAVLKHDLQVMRDAIDKFYADLGRFPGSLDELAQRKYLRKVPIDPITDSETSWIAMPPAEGTGIHDVRSGASGSGLNGTAYETW